jgi:hypothetical protein
VNRQVTLRVPRARTVVGGLLLLAVGIAIGWVLADSRTSTTNASGARTTSTHGTPTSSPATTDSSVAPRSDIPSFTGGYSSTDPQDDLLAFLSAHEGNPVFLNVLFEVNDGPSEFRAGVTYFFVGTTCISADPCGGAEYLVTGLESTEGAGLALEHGRYRLSGYFAATGINGPRMGVLSVPLTAVPESSVLGTPGNPTTPPTTAASALAPGDRCSLGSDYDCIDPDGDGNGTYLIGGGDCMAAGLDGLCSDLDEDGYAGYPDSG